MSDSRGLKRFLTAEKKYDLWVRMLTGQITQSDAAAEAGVNRMTIVPLRKVSRGIDPGCWHSGSGTRSP